MNKDNQLKTSDLSFLKKAYEEGIISADSVLDTLMSIKREQVRKMHPYAITPPSKEGGRWQTGYKGEDGKRKNIKAQSVEELLDKLIPVYFPETHIEKMTFHFLYIAFIL